MDSYLRPLEETKQILKESIISYLGNLTDEEMVPTDAERKAFRQTSPLKEKYTLGMCKLLMYLLNLQYGACRDPNNLTSSEDAVVTEIQLMESKLRHQLPNHMRKKKFEDIDITNLHPGLAKCFLESLLELESALQNKYNETKAEEERIEATAAKNRLKKQRKRDRKHQASAELETQVKADDGLDKKDVVTKLVQYAFEAHCKTKCPSTYSSLSDIVTEDAKDDVKSKRNEVLVNESPSDLSVLEEKLYESRIIENEAVTEGKPEDQSNDEAKNKIQSSFDWNITEWVDYTFENEYSFANVTRSIFGEVDDETDEEEGLMLRYRDLLKAKKERRMLNEIEKLCHESGHFILRAKSPIYKQIIMKKDSVEVHVYDFIVERATPFAIWLERRSKEFAEKVKDGSKPEWWKFIKADVKRILRGVIRALWILSSVGYSCFGLNGMGIFVSGSHAKIKPCAEDEGYKICRGGNGNVRDVRDLRDILYYVIVYPFHPDVNVKVDEIVKMGNPHKNVLNFDSLIDAPFVFTKEERVGFLFKYFELLERGLIPRSIGICITFIEDEDWTLKINGLKKSSGQFSCGEDNVLYSIFWSNKCERYKSPLDVVRYSVNVLKHYNSKDYDKIRPNILKDVEIECLLRDRIPELYCALVRSISRGLCSPDFTWSHSGVCLKELMSRCFAKGECDDGCSPYTLCDHLLA
ncbi:hypothetical protein OROGR_033303 [Orobanche gracilis]